MIFIVWCTGAPESKCRDWNVNGDIFRLMFASVHPFYIVNAARIPLGFPHDPTFTGGQSSLPLTWVNALYTLWKKRGRNSLPAQGKTSYSGPLRRGPSSPVLPYPDNERIWNNIAMQIQITISNIWKWTYSDILLIKHVLVKRQNICRIYLIGINWGEYHWGCSVLYAV